MQVVHAPCSFLTFICAATPSSFHKDVWGWSEPLVHSKHDSMSWRFPANQVCLRFCLLVKLQRRLHVTHQAPRFAYLVVESLTSSPLFKNKTGSENCFQFRQGSRCLASLS
jgi:hypothetical protein